MLTVRAKTFAETLGFGSAGPPTGSGSISGYYTRRSLSQPRVWLLALAGELAFGALFFDGPRRFHATALVALGALLALAYRRTRSQAEGLRLRRRAPSLAHEMDVIEVRIEVVNGSLSPLEDFVLVDRFDGSADAVRTAQSPGPLAPGATASVRYRAVCDGGTGRMRFGPLTAVVADPLGLFEFLVTENEPSVLKVRGAAEPVPALPVQSSARSFAYGNYQTRQAGTSEIFRGIREYHRGDSLRHICWKLSSRHQNLLVKDFERNTNAEVSLVLDMDAKAHVGFKTRSTWHYAKRAALSIAAQQLRNGNRVQLITNGAHVPFGSGRPHEDLLTAALSDAAPLAVPRDEDLLDGIARAVPFGSTLLYISPVHGRRFSERIQRLLRLRVFGLQILCVFVEVDPFILETWVVNQPEDPLMLPPMQRTEHHESLRDAERALSAAGIPAYVLRKDLALSRSLRAPGADR